MGSLPIPLSALFRALGADPVVPPPADASTLAEGTRLAPELMCMPFKLTLGNVKRALEMGADTIVYSTGVWSCRYGCYPRLAENILSELGHRIEVVTLSPRDIRRVLGRLLRLSEANPARAAVRTAQAIRIAWLKSSAIEEIERSSHRLRPLEQHAGDTTRTVRRFLHLIDATDSPAAVVRLSREARAAFAAIRVDDARRPLRIKIVGESYCVLEPFINQNVLERLGGMGVWVDPFLTTHHWLGFHGLRIGNRARQDLLKPARHYWSYNVGGEDENAVAYTLEAARNGYDGVLHLHPFGCMSGTVVGPTLRRVSQDHDIPLLDISLDEHTGKSGFYTRVEAFLSVLEKRRLRSQRGLLSQAESSSTSG